MKPLYKTNAPPPSGGLVPSRLSNCLMVLIIVSLSVAAASKDEVVLPEVIRELLFVKTMFSIIKGPERFW